MELPGNIREQIKEAFRAIAKELGAAVPSNSEANAFAETWWKQEDDLTFRIGCADFTTRKATIYAIEAAKFMCAGRSGDAAAIKLLKLSLAEMKQAVPSN
jgi:hypothetical protein